MILVLVDLFLWHLIIESLPVSILCASCPISLLLSKWPDLVVLYWQTLCIHLLLLLLILIAQISIDPIVLLRIDSDTCSLVPIRNLGLLLQVALLVKHNLRMI